MNNSDEFDLHGSYDVMHNGTKIAEIHQRRFMEGPSFDIFTGEMLEEKLFIKGTPVGMLSGLTIICLNDGAFFELSQK
jgi:hypothetical protein